MKKVDTFYMSEKQIEQMKRTRKFNKKMAVSAILFLVSIASYIALKNVPPVLLDAGVSALTTENISLILQMIYGGGSIASVMTFAKSLHDPLTEEEEKELPEKDAIEKGGFKK